MPRKKIKHKKESFESRGDMGGVKDTSANIYMTMLMSPAWRELTANQQRLYLFMKAQLFKEHPKPIKENRLSFTMNRGKWNKLYGLYKASNAEGFYRDRDALIEYGFIRVLQNGHTTRSKTIYEYSSMWRYWGTSTFEITPHDMSGSMLAKLRKIREEEDP